MLVSRAVSLAVRPMLSKPSCRRCLAFLTLKNFLAQFFGSSTFGIPPQLRKITFNIAVVDHCQVSHRAKCIVCPIGRPDAFLLTIQDVSKVCHVLASRMKTEKG